MSEWREREPCDEHSFCLKHVTHPCEGCGRIAGVSLPPAWHDYIAQLEEKNEALMMAANSFLGLIDCLGGRGSLDDAGPDGKNLAELCDYPDYMNKKIALLADTKES